MRLKRRPGDEPTRLLSLTEPRLPEDQWAGDAPAARVALVTEGTYPGAGGGVSVWCDQLVRGLPDVQFQVVAITLNHRERLRWALPDNVRLANLPLWDRSLEATERTGRPIRVQAVTDLAALLCAKPQEGDRDELTFLDVIDRLIESAIDGELGAGLQYPAMCAAFSEALAGSAFLRHERLGTLLDVTRLAEAFSHLLRPLLFDLGPIDMVHTSAAGLPTLVALGAAARQGVPFMITEHGLFLRERYIAIDSEIDRPAVKTVLLRFYQLLTAAGYRRAHVVAPVSDFNRRWQLRMGAPRDRVRLIHSAVEPNDFPLRLVEPPEPSISWLGRIDPIKDLHTLIRAAAVIRERRSDLKVRLFGSAAAGQRDYLASCRSLIDELSLGDVVTFEGRVDKPAPAFHSGQISVLSSISEGFPYAVLEAMACGVPVVGTDVGGVREAIGDAGRTVPARDHVAMARACLDLFDDRAARRAMGVEGRRRVERMFSLDDMLDHHLGLYTRAAAGATGDELVAVGLDDVIDLRDRARAGAS